MCYSRIEITGFLECYLFLVMSSRVLIFLCTEPTQSFIVRKHTEGVTARNKHVYSQVKLVIVYEYRSLYILLTYVTFCLFYFFNILRYEDAFPLTTSFWFENQVSE